VAVTFTTPTPFPPRGEVGTVTVQAAPVGQATFEAMVEAPPGAAKATAGTDEGAPRKPVPFIVTRVPPATGPYGGNREVTSGGGAGSTSISITRLAASPTESRTPTVNI